MIDPRSLLLANQPLPPCIRCSHFQRTKTFILSSDAKLIWVSPGWGTKCSPEIFGAGWQEFLAPGDHERIAEWLASPEADPITYRYRRAETWITVNVSKTPLADGLWMCAGEISES